MDAGDDPAVGMYSRLSQEAIRVGMGIFYPNALLLLGRCRFLEYRGLYGGAETGPQRDFYGTVMGKIPKRYIRMVSTKR